MSTDTLNSTVIEDTNAPAASKQTASDVPEAVNTTTTTATASSADTTTTTDNDTTSIENKSKTSTTVPKVTPLTTMSNTVNTTTTTTQRSGAKQIDEAGTNLYVRNIPLDFDDNTLLTTFSAYGAVTEHRIMKNLTTKVSLGFGFVRFSKASEAQEAITSMNGYNIGPAPLVVKLAEKQSSEPTRKPNDNLYVKQLPLAWDEANLKQLFEPYGTIKQCIVLKNTSTNMSKGLGFVRYENVDEATAAITALNNYLPSADAGAQKLIVQYAQSEADKQVKQRQKYQNNMNGGGPGLMNPNSRNPYQQNKYQDNHQQGMHRHQHHHQAPPLHQYGHHHQSPSNQQPHHQYGQPSNPYGPSFSQHQQTPYPPLPPQLSNPQQQQQSQYNVMNNMYNPHHQISAAAAAGSAGSAGSAGGGYYNTEANMPQPSPQQQPPIQQMQQQQYYANPSIPPPSMGSSNNPATTAASTYGAYGQQNHQVPTPVTNACQEYQQNGDNNNPQKLLSASANNLMQQQYSMYQHAGAGAPGGNTTTTTTTTATATATATATPGGYSAGQPMHSNLGYQNRSAQRYSPYGGNGNMGLGLGYGGNVAGVGAGGPGAGAGAGSCGTRGGGQSDDTNLFIFHIPYEVDDSQLYALFAPFGALESVKVCTDNRTGASKGFGFVKFANVAEAANAIKMMNGYKIGSKYLKVSVKKSR